MQSGVLGVVKGDVEEVNSFTEQITKDGREVTVSIDVQQQISDLEGDVVAYEGTAAEQVISEKEKVSVDSGKISISEEPELDWNYTNFLLLPSGYVIVESGEGAFLFEILRSRFPLDVQRAEVSLKSLQKQYSEDYEDLTPWKIGFYGREGPVENGVVHGSDVLGDQEIGALLADNAVNQIGLSFLRDNALTKVFVTESGYVEIYQPSDYETVRFVEYVESEIAPHVRLEM